MPKATHKPSPRKRKAGAARATPDQLIDAAGRVFADRGYHATTRRRICKRSGANLAAVNYHFGDKQGLYLAVLKRSVRASKIEVFQNVIEQQAPPEKILREFIKLRLQSSMRTDLPDWHFRLMVHEFAQPSPVLTRVINEVTLPLYQRMRGLVGKIMGLPPDDERTRLCLHSVMGQIFLYVMQRQFLTRLWPELTMSPEQIERIADHIADFSLAYMKQGYSPATSAAKNIQGKKL